MRNIFSPFAAKQKPKAVSLRTSAHTGVAIRSLAMRSIAPPTGRQFDILNSSKNKNLLFNNFT
ncbi:MAG: hypothetical protein IJO28_03205 [Oscillospiraceae bacterium]|nr:hypothetical protein [Oscillospiraceae bacterium]